MLRAAWLRRLATDLPTYAGIVASVFVVTAIACWLPARRAARTDPATVLRSE